MWKFSIKLPIAMTSIMLLIATLNCQYGYYVLLRLVVSAVALLLLWHAHNSKQVFWFWIFCLIALVFNPLIPVNFNKKIWQFLDITVIAVLSLYLLTNQKTPISKTASHVLKVLLMGTGVLAVIFIFLTALGVIYHQVEVSDQTAKDSEDAKQVKLNDFSIAKIDDLFAKEEGSLSDCEISGTIQNDTDRVIYRIDLKLEFFTQDNYLIKEWTIAGFLDNYVLTPRSETPLIARRRTIFLPSQEYKVKFSIEKVYFRKKEVK